MCVYVCGQMDRAGATVAEVKRELVDQYKDEMERRMAKTIWVRGKCPRASRDRGMRPQGCITTPG